MGVAGVCGFGTRCLRQRRLTWAEQCVRDGKDSARQRRPRSPAGRLPEGGQRNVRWLRSQDSPFARYAVETPSRGARSRTLEVGQGSSLQQGGGCARAEGGPQGKKSDKGQVTMPGREGRRGLLEDQGMPCAERVAESPEEGVDMETPGAVSPEWAQGREEARAGGRA